MFSESETNLKGLRAIENKLGLSNTFAMGFGRFKLFIRNGTLLDSVRLDASSMCQLRCPLCLTGNRLNRKGPVGWGYLEFGNFRKFLGDNTWVKRVELSNWGEIFLNPELEDIIKYAHRKRVLLSAENGVNLNTVDEHLLECLVRYRFRSLSVSIDGASSETYGLYRKGGDFNRVIGNVKMINSYKKLYRTAFPKLSWQFVVMGHNEHELPAAKRMAMDLGMRFTPKMNWEPAFSPLKDVDFVRRESGLEISSGGYSKSPYYCNQLWDSPQINWDGKLLGCCCNFWEDFGNVFESGLKHCLKGDKYVYAKKMLLGKRKSRGDMPCTRCSGFESFLNEKAVVKSLFYR